MFSHLDNFQEKLNKKKQKMRSWKKRSKPFPDEKRPFLKINEQKK